MPRLLPKIGAACGIIGKLDVLILAKPRDIQRDAHGDIRPGEVDLIRAVGTGKDGIFHRKRGRHNLPATVVYVFADEVDAACGRDTISIFFVRHT